jgi:hypothetical protein
VAAGAQAAMEKTIERIITTYSNLPTDFIILLLDLIWGWDLG